MNDLESVRRTRNHSQLVPRWDALITASLILIVTCLTPEVQASSTEITVGGPPAGTISTPLNPLQAAFLGKPVFSSTHRAEGLSALELSPTLYSDVPIPKIAMQITSITSYRHMLEVLGVGVQAAYGGSLAQVSAALHLARSVEIKDTSTYFLIIGTAESEPVSVKIPPRLRAEIYPRDDQERRLFYRVFGDGWVSEITLGGRIYALFEVETHTRRERDDLRANFEIVASEGKLKTSFQRTFSELLGKRSIKVTYIQEGGSEVLKGVEGLAGIDQILSAIQGLWNTFKEQPVILRWTASLYEAVDGIPRPPRFLSVPRYKRAVEEAAGLHAIARERLTALRYTLDRPEQFIAVDETTVENWIAGLELYVKDLEKFTVELEAVEIPEAELDARLAQVVQDPRMPPSQALPQEHPLFELFALPIGREAFRTRTDFDRKGTCHRQQTEVLTPIRLDLAPDYRSVRYEYKLDATNRRHRCKGSWHESEDFTVFGSVLIELGVEHVLSGQATVKIISMKDDQKSKVLYRTINYGADTLMAAIKAKDGSVVQWPDLP